MSSTNGAGARRSVPIGQVEALLRSLAGVGTAELQTEADGRVRLIRLGTDGRLLRDQLVRNVQSALLAHFGFLVDARSIEVVSDEERRSEPFGESGAVAGLAEDAGGGANPAVAPARTEVPAPDRTVLELLERPVVERRLRHGIRCRVKLGFGRRVVEGEAETLGGAVAAPESAARAVLDAIRNAGLEGAESIELDGVRATELAGRRYIVVGVRAVDLRAMHHLAGATVVQDSDEEAAAEAALAAVEQWLARRSLQ